MKNFLLIFFFSTNYFVGLGQIEPPVFEWAKSFGGWQDDYLMDMVVDEEGSVYVTGFFYDFICFDTLCLDAASPDTSDIFVAKYDSTGAVSWARVFGSNGVDEGRALGLDGGGNLYLAGGFSGTVDFGGIHLTASDTGSYPYIPAEIFILKMDPSGTILWRKQVQGNSADRISHMGIDKQDNLWLAGTSFSTLIEAGNISVNNTSNFNFVIIKIGTSGDVALIKTIDTSQGGGFGLSAVATDLTGELYVSGYLDRSILVEGNPVAGVFILKLDSQGAYLWSKSFINPSPNRIRINDITTDDANALLLTGNLQGEVWFDTIQVQDEGPFPPGGYFLAKYSSEGKVQWVDYARGSTDGGRSIVTLRDQIYTMGSYRFPFQLGNTVLTTSNQRDDLFLSRHDTEGNIVWARSIGSPAIDWPLKVRSNPSGHLYVSGTFPDFHTILDSIVIANIYGSNFDLWVGRLSQDSLPPVEIPPPIGQWKVYPNPFDHGFTVFGDLEAGETLLQLFDLAGRLVYTDSPVIISDQTRIWVEVPHIADGLYILRISQQNQPQTFKMLKQSR